MASMSLDELSTRIASVCARDFELRTARLRKPRGAAWARDDLRDRSHDCYVLQFLEKRVYLAAVRH